MAPPRREPPAPQYSRRQEVRVQVRPEQVVPRKTDVWRTADRLPVVLPLRGSRPYLPPLPLPANRATQLPPEQPTPRLHLAACPGRRRHDVQLRRCTYPVVRACRPCLAGKTKRGNSWSGGFKGGFGGSYSGGYRSGFSGGSFGGGVYPVGPGFGGGLAPASFAPVNFRPGAPTFIPGGATKVILVKVKHLGTTTHPGGFGPGPSGPFGAGPFGHGGGGVVPGAPFGGGFGGGQHGGGFGGLKGGKGWW
ncbi:hypothetical protein HPB47_010829 [Ixodes persulcatus]|uniref:Uncharacterized protein n=1 Tax=Ixodes persulcatus TaxID=34615 RepID=A0AC60NY04_IXOPE|nr:hypothetical protein HPB47_010829 [Ixodes persulcatus]